MSDDQQLQELIGRLWENSKSELPKWAWPGGYAVAYIADDGEFLCQPCAMSDGHLGGASDGFRVIGYVTADWHDLGEGDWCCAHCNNLIDPDPEGVEA